MAYSIKPICRHPSKKYRRNSSQFSSFQHLSSCSAHPCLAADYPAPKDADYIIHDFPFQTGDSLPELKIHYRTLGTPQRDDHGIVRNAVLILHGTTGSGKQFLRPTNSPASSSAKANCSTPKQYFIILPDDIGHGESSKPSDGLHARFPRYGYADMVDAEYRLLTDGLGVNHLRLVIGTSMGGMHTWLWGETYPDFMDALMPLASLPAQISGRNRVWRRIIIDAIRNDPAWTGGNYQSQPPALRTVGEIMLFMSSNPLSRYQEAPTSATADKLLDDYAKKFLQTHDANDVLYAVEGSSDYDPAPACWKKSKPHCSRSIRPTT